MMFLALTALGAETWEGRAFFVGDPHVHTGVSGDAGSSDFARCDGACGAIAEVFDLARDQGLDWMVVSDHVNGVSAGSLESYGMLHEAMLDAHDPDGGFVTVPGAEVWFVDTSGAPLGHKTLMLFGDQAQLEGLTITEVQPTGSDRVEIEDCGTIDTWMTGLAAARGPALLIPHHPALTQPMATAWECHHPEWEPAVEVYSQHGLSLDRSPAWDVSWAAVDPDGSAEAALDPEAFGLQLGFLAGTDSHDTQPGSVCSRDGNRTSMPFGGGLTVAVLPEHEAFDRPALHRAIQTRHTYATTGPVVPMLVEFTTGGAAVGGMGDQVGVPPGQPVEARVRVPAELGFAVTAVSLVGPNLVQALTPVAAGEWSALIDGGSLPAWLYAELELDGSHWWGHKTCDDGGEDAREWIWGSPSYFVEAEPDLDGDGWAWADGDCHDGDPAVHPGADETWYDGVDQDCSGGSDFDQDGDGVELDADCDDADPSRAADCSPGVNGWRQPEPGGPSSGGHVDGAPALDPEPAATGCAHVPGPAGVGLLLSLAALLAGRRRPTG